MTTTRRGAARSDSEGPPPDISTRPHSSAPGEETVQLADSAQELEGNRRQAAIEPPSENSQRPGIHRRAPSRLGVSDPRQEGPIDLRLLPPALAVWATAAYVTGASWRTAMTITATGAVLAALLLVYTVYAKCRPSPPESSEPAEPPEPLEIPAEGPGRRGRTGTGERARTGDGAGHRARAPRIWGRYTAGAVLLCVTASAASAALHAAEVHRGPVPDLARRSAHATVELKVLTDPRRTRPRVTGERQLPTSVLEAQALRLTTADGSVTRTRAPVLLLAEDPPDPAEQRLRKGAAESTGPPYGPRTTAEGAASAAAESPSPWLRLLPSTVIRVPVRLTPPYRDGDRIAAVARVTRGEQPTVVRGPTATQRFAGRMRAGLREATDSLPPEARAVLPGLVVGDTSRMTPELYDAFQATDLTHVLAVSGANFTILLALLIGPPGSAHRAERRGLAPRFGIGLRATALLGGTLTLAFVLVCRPEPSVLRAATCGSLALVALATGRRRSLLPALAAAVVLLVLYDPWLARSYGFVLSVLATGALLVLAPRWSTALQRRGMPPRGAEALAAALAAQAVCAPVVVLMAARVSLVAVPCNLLAELAVAPATVLGFGVLLTAPFAMPLAEGLAWCASWPVGWIVRVARTGAGLPGNGVDWPGGWRGGLLLALLTVCLVVAGRRLVRHPWACVACVLGLILAVLQPPSLTRVFTGWPPPGWRFVMCDVGQGDAGVLAVGDGSAVVIDTGPDPALADRCLRLLGIRSIRLVLLTHFHADHVAGLPGVLRGRAVGAIETTGLQDPYEQAEFVHRTTKEHGIPVRQAVAGERRRTGDLDWQVLWPPPAPAQEGANDASVTLLVRSRGLRLLLLGDLEPPAQQALLASPAGGLVTAVDVLKVAHHGSAYQDPELLRRARPRLALISAGEGNPYGHPSPHTVTALRSMGTEVLRTDQDGALAVMGTGGEGLRAATEAR